jgi:hypothetical protein
LTADIGVFLARVDIHLIGCAVLRLFIIAPWVVGQFVQTVMDFSDMAVVDQVGQFLSHVLE